MDTTTMDTYIGLGSVDQAGRERILRSVANQNFDNQVWKVVEVGGMPSPAGQRKRVREPETRGTG